MEYVPKRQESMERENHSQENMYGCQNKSQTRIVMESKMYVH